MFGFSVWANQRYVPTFTVRIWIRAIVSGQIRDVSQPSLFASGSALKCLQCLGRSCTVLLSMFLLLPDGGFWASCLVPGTGAWVEGKVDGDQPR